MGNRKWLVDAMMHDCNDQWISDSTKVTELENWNPEAESCSQQKSEVEFIEDREQQ